MSVVILKAGLQTTIQSVPRSGQRHLGVPASGPADPLSMALANRLVGNDLLAPALEVTLSGISIRFESPVSIAIAGANASVELDGNPQAMHRTLRVAAGDVLRVGHPEQGARVYIAFASGLSAQEILGSASTYIPAGLGGYQGRALENGDRLNIRTPRHDANELETPAEFQPPMATSFALRVCDSAETGQLQYHEQFFDTNFAISTRCDRMGLMLEGPRLRVDSDGRMPSAPVFPGTVQCPEDGRPIVLSVDAQTTGGYPRVAQVTRADRHLLGQLRPGDHVRFLWRNEQSAIDELRAKIGYWRGWLRDVERVI